MQEPTKQTLNRREILKVLAAAGGAVGAAAFLPVRWSKPAIEACVIPAHAQASFPLAISNLTAHVNAQNGVDGYGDFDWDDPLGEVSCGAQFSAAIQGCANSVSIDCLGVGNDVGGLTGYLEFAFSTDCHIQDGDTLCLTMKVDGRVSNQTCGPISVPED